MEAKVAEAQKVTNQSGVDQYTEHNSKKVGINLKARVIGQVSLLLGAIGLIIIGICSFTIENFDFENALQVFLLICCIPLFLYLKAIFDFVKENMTEDQRKIQLLNMAKERDAEFKQYRLIFSGSGSAFCALMSCYSLIHCRSLSSFLNAIIMIVVCIFVAVWMIGTGVKNMREMRQILDEEAAGKLDYLKHQNDEQPNYIRDSAFEGQASQIDNTNSTSLSGTGNSEPKTYDSIQF